MEPLIWHIQLSLDGPLQTPASRLHSWRYESSSNIIIFFLRSPSKTIREVIHQRNRRPQQNPDNMHEFYLSPVTVGAIATPEHETVAVPSVPKECRGTFTFCMRHQQTSGTPPEIWRCHNQQTKYAGESCTKCFTLWGPTSILSELDAVKNIVGIIIPPKRKDGS